MRATGRNRKLRVWVAALIFALAPAPPATAHPHVWINVSCEVLFDAERRATGVVESWSFDEMYSSFAVTGLKRGPDGKLTHDALAGLAKTIVDASGQQDHFTAATVGGRTLKLIGANAENAELGADGQLVVRFRLDIETPQAVAAEKLRIEVVDPDLYADFRFVDLAQTNGGAPAGCTVELDDPAKHLPKDPDAIEKALIDGPLVPMKTALTVGCG